MKLSGKMNHFQTSIFNELADYKKEKINDGREMIDLSIGSPDLPPPEFVREELAANVKDPSQYGYTLTGTDDFLQAAVDYYKERYGVCLDAKEEALMVMGSQDGLVHLPLTITDPGNLILVPDPGYTAYETGVSLAEATPYKMPLKEENHFLPDLDAIPEEVRNKAKLMILNFPGNPVPALASREFFEKVVEFAKTYQITILHDFAYSELYYEEKPVSFLSIEGAKDVGVEFNSLSKSFNMAGCRIGYVVGNVEIIEALSRLKSNLDYGVFLPIQKAAVKALRNSAQFSDDLRTIYQERRDQFVNGLHQAGWSVESPKASMFVWAKVPHGTDSKSFAYQLMDEAGIVVVPGQAFGEKGEGYVRIALTQDKDTLRRAAEKVKESGLFLSRINWT
ncbi:LL-diaminopimelate aminotransferase [Virgibacillus sp. MSP4-1]|uniref:LL-diaminopimelate aminotransferase n=1 Tax=Virgibacillus sp. MSP4-1 TaxID=2700081 RepID=UPI0003A2BE03|nr:LL-diaminopimelate aminotransferase [Virgibacillus sp. MSP4-1]QHS21843.1 LL-diaminopimelate aminotransferase [Virgibacillus sp. MSP4-1]